MSCKKKKPCNVSFLWEIIGKYFTYFNSNKIMTMEGIPYKNFLLGLKLSIIILLLHANSTVKQ